ncbi:hypothetical protein VW35_14655, partial [Devosia soli]
VSSGQFRRDTAGLLSIRPGTTSSNWKLLSLGIGADIETHTVIKSDVQIIQLKPKRQTGAPWRLPPDRVIKQTSETAGYWHDWARGLGS